MKLGTLLPHFIPLLKDRTIRKFSPSDAVKLCGTRLLPTPFASDVDRRRGLAILAINSSLRIPEWRGRATVPKGTLALSVLPMPGPPRGHGSDPASEDSMEDHGESPLAQRHTRGDPEEPEGTFDRLKELAIIATGPESPLLRDSPPLPRQRSFSLSALHSYARPPRPHCDHPLLPLEPLSPKLVLTPEDRSAALTLTSMAQHRVAAASAAAVAALPSTSETNGIGGSPSRRGSRTRHVSWPDPSKPRRPMNGFMLFAQKHRGEYSHLHPGKDNRAISVMLGDQWRRMKSEEKKLYSLEAKVRADEVKKAHPDCWKRKRSYSTSL